MQPQLSLTREAIVYTIDASEDPTNIDEFCLSSQMSQVDSTPDRLSHKQDEINKKLLELNNTRQYYMLRHIRPEYWAGLERKTMSPVVHVLSTLEAFKGHCSRNHKDINLDICALVYSMARHHDSFDSLGAPPNKTAEPRHAWRKQLFPDFDQSLIGGLEVDGFGFDANLAIQVANWLLGYAILALGLAMWYFGVELNHGALQKACFVLNVLLHVPSLYYL